MKAPDSVIASSLTAKGSTPTARAASSLSRTACSRAPKREWRSQAVTTQGCHHEAQHQRDVTLREPNCRLATTPAAAPSGRRRRR
jgi:hypothetical protein